MEHPRRSLKKINSKSRTHSFHHEITTDGQAVSMLFSRRSNGDNKENHSKLIHKPTCDYPGREVGVDPGKKNIVMLTDENAISLRYTSAQRNYESKLKRYTHVLLVEKSKVPAVIEAHVALSLHRRKTNDLKEFEKYLEAKSLYDKRTAFFYKQDRWRGWKFRIYSNRKRSEQTFCNRVAETYGEDCTLFYGDWSRRDQMGGCTPSPVVGIKKLLSKRFIVKDVDEFRTSKTCNRCEGELSTYYKLDGRRSRSRLCCTNCAGQPPKARSKRFVDRDLNAALNILLAGTASTRPTYLSRSKRQLTDGTDDQSVKRPCGADRPLVDARGPLSDPNPVA